MLATGGGQKRIYLYRTKRVNSIILQIAHLAKVSAENKKGIH
jgi:hypothetical protein